MRTAISLIAIWLLINALFYVMLTRSDKSAR
ncbi:preprotein translocase subunit YajC [Bradyrhizobium sp. USDA 4516]